MCTVHISEQPGGGTGAPRYRGRQGVRACVRARGERCLPQASNGKNKRHKIGEGCRPTRPPARNYMYPGGSTGWLGVSWAAGHLATYHTRAPTLQLRRRRRDCLAGCLAGWRKLQTVSLRARMRTSAPEHASSSLQPRACQQATGPAGAGPCLAAPRAARPGLPASQLRLRRRAARRRLRCARPPTAPAPVHAAAPAGYAPNPCASPRPRARTAVSTCRVAHRIPYHAMP